MINFVIKGCRINKVLFYSIQLILGKGLPYLFKDHGKYYFKLPSVGPFYALHDLWKQPLDDDKSLEQLKRIDQIRSNSKVFHSRALKKGT